MARTLEDRLLKVSTEVSPECHADIGTDHGLLPLYLLSHGLCRRVIATEKSPSAYRIAKQALWGRSAEVRLGDGLEALRPGEAQSLSLCGLGGSLMAGLLARGAVSLPDRVVVQANRDTWKLRRWAWEGGYHLIREQLAEGHWLYEVLTFQRRSGPDPSYFGVPWELAVHFGPLLLRAKHPLLERELERRARYLDNRPLHADKERVNNALTFLYSSEIP